MDFSRSILIFLIIAAYIVVLLLISHFTGKGASNSTFFNGNKNIPWPIVALAMITAPISGVTFISVPGMVVIKGYSYLQMCLGFIVGYLVIAWILVPLFYKNNIISIYKYLEDRFGNSTYKTGAWFFLISKTLGIGIRFLIICSMLQFLVFEPLGIPIPITVALTMLLIWLYTKKGGVKTVIWVDTFKSFCLLVSLVMCLFFIIHSLGFSIGDLPGLISSHNSTKIFNFENPTESSYFWKQFIAGVFLVIAMTGLDQDMMQRTLACKDASSSRKNLVVSGILQFVVIAIFLVLGTLLIIYAESKKIAIPTKTDDLFATVAFHEELPVIVCILFIIGLVASTYSSVGSALTSLTISYTIDILEANNKNDEKSVKKIRNRVHAVMAIIVGLVVLAFYYLNDQDAISAVYTMASYTYGPILGLFIFGLSSKRKIQTKWLPAICISAPILSWLIQYIGKTIYGYETGFELLLINAGITMLGLFLMPTAKVHTYTEMSDKSLA